MRIRSWNNELAICNLLFLRIFNNILIERTYANGEKKLIKVNTLIGNRSRVFKDLLNADKAATYKLPLIVIKRNGYSKNPDRLNEMHNEVKYELGSNNRIVDLMTPIPIDVEYEMSVITKNVSDADLIASNFMIFFNSSTFVSCEHPKYKGVKMNNQVVLQDSVSEEHPDEIDGGADDFIVTTFNFTFKTYMFGGIQQANKRCRTCTNLNCQCNNSGACTCRKNCNGCANQATSPGVNPDNSNLSSETEYDGFVPIINKIDLGIYATPKLSSFEPFMISADNMPLSSHWLHVDHRDVPQDTRWTDENGIEHGWVDATIWTIE